MPKNHAQSSNGALEKCLLYVLKRRYKFADAYDISVTAVTDRADRCKSFIGRCFKIRKITSSKSDRIETTNPSPSLSIASRQQSPFNRGLNSTALQHTTATGILVNNAARNAGDNDRGVYIQDNDTNEK